jgi:hypothetical protein
MEIDDSARKKILDACRNQPKDKFKSPRTSTAPAKKPDKHPSHHARQHRSISDGPTTHDNSKNITSTPSKDSPQLNPTSSVAGDINLNPSSPTHTSPRQIRLPSPTSPTSPTSPPTQSPNPINKLQEIPDNINNAEFEFVEKLGTGASGDVFKGRYRSHFLIFCFLLSDSCFFLSFSLSPSLSFFRFRLCKINN